MLPDTNSPDPIDDSRVGYVLKMYPRFSETFILTELLALQETGQDFEVFSLRKPSDGRFHEALSRMTAPVTYLDSSTVKAPAIWETLVHAQARLPGWHEQHHLLWQLDVADAAQALELAELCAARGITHLHAHFASISARVARVAAALAGIGYSVTTHAKDIFHREVDQQDLSRVLHDATAVVAISEFNRTHLLAGHPQLRERITLVRNGLDLESFTFHNDLRSRPRRVAAVGRLVEKKGFGDLLQATAVLVADGVDLVVDLVGTGELHDQLRAQVSDLGLAEHVVLHSAQPQHRVREIITGATVLAAPCIVAADGNRDGLPTVLLEAMALGTPCVSTPVTGIGEAVRDADTGLLVRPGDVRQLAGALRRLLDDRRLGGQLAHNARREVETNYDCRRQVHLKRALFGTAGPATATGLTQQGEAA